MFLGESTKEKESKMDLTSFKDAFDSGYDDYKKIKIKKINGIYIKHFRSMFNRTIELGDNITILSGKNGTMKSSILGLIAHPFSSPNNAKDCFGNELKTDMRDVFSLSLEKDKDRYLYYLNITTTDDITYSEPIRVYIRPKENRHRITVGKDNKKNKGNFLLNTAYINLKRLIPIVETDAVQISQSTQENYNKFAALGYSKILQKTAFSSPEPVSDGKNKNTFGPTDTYYDFKSISSGEDNIGHILNKMYAFIDNKTSDSEALQGILCIDEIEASLHPVAQENLFNFLFTWSQKNHVQVVLTTHSLYMIQYAIMRQKDLPENSVVINMISTAFVADNNYKIIKNPDYEEAYKELTLKTIEDLESSYKINIICEDDIAEYYLKMILSKRIIRNQLNFIHNLTSESSGNSCKGLASLMKNGEKLLENSIIVFDPEVADSAIPESKVSHAKLPSRYNLPIEKTIAKYIYDLPGDSDFFIKYKKEKDSFLNDFSQNEILTLLGDEAILKSSNIKRFKQWFNNDSKRKQYINYYAKNNPDVVNPFYNYMISLINEKLIDKSLPPIQ